jgi:hypothetical protein
MATSAHSPRSAWHGMATSAHCPRSALARCALQVRVDARQRAFCARLQRLCRFWRRRPVCALPRLVARVWLLGPLGHVWQRVPRRKRRLQVHKGAGSGVAYPRGACSCAHAVRWSILGLLCAARSVGLRVSAGIGILEGECRGLTLKRENRLNQFDQCHGVSPPAENRGANSASAMTRTRRCLAPAVWMVGSHR